MKLWGRENEGSLIICGRRSDGKYLEPYKHLFVDNPDTVLGWCLDCRAVFQKIDPAAEPVPCVCGNRRIALVTKIDAVTFLTTHQKESRYGHSSSRSHVLWD